MYRQEEATLQEREMTEWRKIQAKKNEVEERENTLEIKVKQLETQDISLDKEKMERKKQEGKPEKLLLGESKAEEHGELGDLKILSKQKTKPNERLYDPEEQEKKEGKYYNNISEQEKIFGKQEEKLEQDKPLEHKEMSMGEKLRLKEQFIELDCLKGYLDYLGKELRKQNVRLEEKEMKLGEQNDSPGRQKKTTGEREGLLDNYELHKLKMRLKDQERKQEVQDKNLLEQVKKVFELKQIMREQLEQFDRMLGIYEKALEEQKIMIRNQKEKLEKQEMKLIEQDKRQEQQERKLDKQERTIFIELHKLEIRFDHQERTIKQEKVLLEETTSKLQSLQDSAKESDEILAKVSDTIYHDRNFEMKEFSKEKAKDKNNHWKSPAMYTHVGGYKFYIGVFPNGRFDGSKKSMDIEVWSTPGEFDLDLAWPAKGKFTLSLANRKGGKDIVWTSTEGVWDRPEDNTCSRIAGFCRIRETYSWAFIEHSELHNFLENDSLHFSVCNVEML